MMWNMWGMPIGMGWMGFGGLWMILLWGGLIALTVWGVVRLTRRETPALKRDPLDVAKERYARGEISQEEFKQIKKDLS